MSLRYCSLHQRLFSRRDQRWGPFPHETIDAADSPDDQAPGRFLWVTVPVRACGCRVLYACHHPGHLL
jgi:hypothetical protein